MGILKTTAVNAGIMPDHTRAGVVLNRYGVYTIATIFQTAKTIEMVPIPKGARIVGMGLSLSSAVSDVTISVGDGSATNRFFASLAGSADFGANMFGEGASNGWNYKYTAQDTIDVYTGDSDLGVGVKIRLNVQYVMTGTIADET
jgi:hypothetical protein